MPETNEQPRGPTALAQLCAETIAELEAKRATVPRSQRKEINRRLHTTRYLLRWCKTRAGYRDPGSILAGNGGAEQAGPFSNGN